MNSKPNFSIASLPMNIHPKSLDHRVSRRALCATHRCRLAAVGASALLLIAPLACLAADNSKTFSTPEEAVTALGSAATAKDTNALAALFGAGFSDLQNPDPVLAARDLDHFATSISETNRVVRQSDDRYLLEIGTNFWPFPVPLVKQGDRWLFDTAAGKDELLSRRIGRDELDTLQVMRAYVEAQREYASRDRDGDEVLQYAQRLISSPGTHEGLYWPPGPDGETSPLGPLVAFAQEKGYTTETLSAEPGGPFHGYYFKILTRQGSHAPGGKHDYIMNGKMIAGFALVAWPARYGDSGIMTFIVNQQGRVYQKDLGPKTEKVVKKMKAYDPDPSWQLSPD